MKNFLAMPARYEVYGIEVSFCCILHFLESTNFLARYKNFYGFFCT